MLSREESLPTIVETYLEAAEQSGYEVRRWYRQNKQIRHDGRPVGVWNNRHRHWYITGGAAHHREDILKRCGFVPHHRLSGYVAWVLHGGPTMAPAFSRALHELTGVQIDSPS